MSRASPMQNAFNGGELSPRMRGRTDEAVYGLGCESMLGWLPLLQGPAIAAPGTIFVARAKGPHRLIPFEYNVTQGYQIEASDHAFRFYTNDVRIEPVAGTPLEIATPYSYAEVLQLDYDQSEDVLYLFHPAHPVMELRRTGAEAFELVAQAQQGGPFEDENGDDAVTVTASVAGGVTPPVVPGVIVGSTMSMDVGASVTLTAASAIFSAGDVGGLFRLAPKDFSDVKAWEAGYGPIAVGDRRRSAGKVYQATATSGSKARTGTVPPQHSEGEAWDGTGGEQEDLNGEQAGGIKWEYIYGSGGYGRITAVASATSATMTVIAALASSLATVGSRHWAFGAYSDGRGYPQAGTIWNERLVLAKGARLDGSVVGGFNDFSAEDSSGNAQRDLAFTELLDDANPVQWLAADTRLLAGTARREHAIEQVKVQSEAASPPVLDSSPQSRVGSANTRPILANGRVLFIQRAGRKLIESGYSVTDDRFVPRDMTAFAEHIAKPGLVELAWQQELEGLVWAVRQDGTLAAMTYSPGQQVMGWAPRTLGGGMLARTISVNTDPEGKRDELWIGAQSGSQWWVLLAAKIWELGDAPSSAWLVDAGLSYTGAAVDRGTGAGHLAGRTVQVLADGKPHHDIVVGADGSWALDYPAGVVTLGLAVPNRLVTMAIEAGGEDGTAQGKIKKISAVTLRLLETQGIRVAVQDNIMVADEHRIPVDLMDRAVPLFTGDVKLDTVGSYERLGKISIERFQPTPATLLAIMPTITTAPR